MNLHSLANGAIQAINQNQLVTLKQYSGSSQNDHYERSPAYSVMTISAQIQALSSDQLHTAGNLNLQGEMKSVITAIALKGLSSPDQKGGDMLNFDGHDWLVVHIQETFNDHTLAIVQKQK
jgi:hypothetical protein